jgi:polyisoprenoid-binding protein YceI
MRTFGVFFVPLAVSVAIFGGVAAAEQEIKVPLDPSSSVVTWVGKKVTGQHNGSVRIRSGEALLKDGVFVGGTFEVDLSTISVEDIKDERDNQKLTNHLKSEDFFAANLFPTATFTVTSATPIKGASAGAPNYNVTGDLVIKGITRPVSFPAVITIENGMAKASAKFDLDRTQWNVRYGSGKFFENLGDRLIYDNFEVALDVRGALPNS